MWTWGFDLFGTHKCQKVISLLIFAVQISQCANLSKIRSTGNSNDFYLISFLCTMSFWNNLPVQRLYIHEHSSILASQSRSCFKSSSEWTCQTQSQTLTQRLFIEKRDTEIKKGKLIFPIYQISSQRHRTHRRTTNTTFSTHYLS